MPAYAVDPFEILNVWPAQRHMAVADTVQRSQIATVEQFLIRELATACQVCVVGWLAEIGIRSSMESNHSLIACVGRSMPAKRTLGLVRATEPTTCAEVIRCTPQASAIRPLGRERLPAGELRIPAAIAAVGIEPLDAARLPDQHPSLRIVVEQLANNPLRQMRLASLAHAMHMRALGIDALDLTLTVMVVPPMNMLRADALAHLIRVNPIRDTGCRSSTPWPAY
jgi:hypothetical protein